MTIHLASLIADLYVSLIDDRWAREMPDRNIETPSLSVEADQIAQVARALAHPARVRIIAFLLSKPGCIGGDIVDQVGLAQSTVSEHLRILKDAGIVQGAIDYPRICYSLAPSALAPLRGLVAAVAAHPADSAAPCRLTPEACVSEETVK